MSNPIISSAKKAAIATAKQMAQEPLEVLKSSATQVTGTESTTSSGQSGQAVNPQQSIMDEQDIQRQKKADLVKSKNLLSAYEAELKNIRNQKLIKELQQKIANGETVYLLNFPELTEEQRKYLEAQVVAYTEKKRQEQMAAQTSVPQISSKPSRRMGAGKQNVKSEQTRVENVKPPSG